MNRIARAIISRRETDTAPLSGDRLHKQLHDSCWLSETNILATAWEWDVARNLASDGTCIENSLEELQVVLQFRDLRDVRVRRHGRVFERHLQVVEGRVDVVLAAVAAVRLPVVVRRIHVRLRLATLQLYLQLKQEATAAADRWENLWEERLE